MVAHEFVKWQLVRILKGIFSGATQTRDVVQIKIDRIHYSKLDVGRSMLDVHQFLFDQTGRYLARGGARVKLRF